MTRKIKTVSCPMCGAGMLSAVLNDVWGMRVDGKLHQVPVSNIPCDYCTACDIYLLSGLSDDEVMRSYTAYINAHGLNTRWHKIKRVIRRFFRRLQWRWLNGVTYWRRNTKLQAE